MLWRVRTTLPDQPGTLAVLARRCGQAGVNILGMQIFPGLDEVTDEIVLRSGEAWTVEHVTALVVGAGGRNVVAQPSTEAALDDQPTRYVMAARAVLEQPMSFPEVIARLFDAEADPASASVVHDTMDLIVGDIEVQVHRSAPFTDTERARGSAIADLVSHVLSRAGSATRPANVAGHRPSTSPEYVAGSGSVAAWVDGVVVGRAVLGDPQRLHGVVQRAVEITVESDWRRRGIGTRLLLHAARLTHNLGSDELLWTARSDDPAVLPLVLGTGLRARIRLSGDQLSVRVPVGALKPTT
jgi:GNAT superfamily N-acetyltransferase